MNERIACPALQSKVISAQEAAELIQDGMIIGTSGFTPCGYPKAIPLALAERVRQGAKIQVDLQIGASVGRELDQTWTELGIIKRRCAYQGDKALRQALNTVGGVEYQDHHISHSPQQTRYGFFGGIDLAIVEVCAITKEGHLVPTTSVGNTPAYVQAAKQVLIEVNTSQPEALFGLHDIYTPLDPPQRQPIPLTHTGQRIGQPYIECPLEKIAGIVYCDIPDDVAGLSPIDDNSRAMAAHLLDFFHQEVKRGRLPAKLLPLQSGVGNVANAVLAGINESDFAGLDFYSEVIQDSVFDLIDSGKFATCSGTGLTPSPAGLQRFFDRLDFYKKHVVLRPQEISNHPEIIRRLGVISMNTAIEVDIYGHVNSTHVMGTKMMNGIGGSGDFTRNAYLSIFLTPSVAKGGAISSIVPMCSHIDHTEHDVMIVVSEQGLADLRNKSPRERALEIINHCAHPDYRPLLLDYYQRACATLKPGACHTPHLLREALSFHTRFQETGTMMP